MGYRKLERKPRPKNRNMQDTATPGRIFVHNGATAYFAIPCYYQEVRHPVPAKLHDRLVHDHRGWPDPRSRDRSCQSWDFARCECRRGLLPPYVGIQSERCGCEGTCRCYVDMARLFPIHLTREGYSKASVNMMGKPQELNAIAWIDEKDDWVVRVLFDAHITTDADYEFKPITIPFSVKVSRYNSQGQVQNRDIVSLGELTILPAPNTNPSV